MPKITTVLFGDLAFLPYQVEKPVKERMEWLTDIIPDYRGGEERIDNRSIPRYTFEYKIPLQYVKKSDVFNTLYGALRKNWAIPIWTEAQVVGNLTALQTIIICNTQIHDLRDDSLVLIYSNSLWEVAEIQVIGSSHIQLFTGLVFSHTNAFVIPVRIGYIVEDVDINTTGREGELNLKYQVDDNLELLPEQPTQYLSKDIYFTPTLISGSLNRTLEQQQNIIEFGLGPIERRTPWLNARYGSPFFSLMEGAQEVRDFKNFCYRRVGKFREFWLPTFENDLRIKSAGIIVTTFEVEADSIIDYSQQRINIAFQDLQGNWYPRGVVNYNLVDSTTVEVTIDSALNLNVDQIMIISYLGLNRLNTDRIQFNWIGNGVVISNFQVLELLP